MFSSLIKTKGRGSGVTAYIHNSANFVIKYKAYDHGAPHDVDYLINKLLHLKMSLC